MKGSIVHLAVQRIADALVNGGCSSLQDAKSTSTMRALGGLTTVIRDCVQLVVEPYRASPRCSHTFEAARSSLKSQEADIRTQVQSLLRRLRFPDGLGNATYGKAKSSKATGNTALGPGIHTEVDLSATEIGLRGRADLVMITPSRSEIVDFKTGKFSDQHRSQILIYALLWYKDARVNPSGRRADKLTISYLAADVDVPSPSIRELERLDSDIRQRARVAIAAASARPPEARPDSAICRYCDVRHLCDIYWSVGSRCGLAQGLGGHLPYVDSEITLVQRQGSLSWDGVVTASTLIDPGTRVVLHLPLEHQKWTIGNRLRVINGFLETQEADDLPVVLTVSSRGEVFLVPGYP